MGYCNNEAIEIPWLWADPLDRNKGRAHVIRNDNTCGAITGFSVMSTVSATLTSWRHHISGAWENHLMEIGVHTTEDQVLRKRNAWSSEMVCYNRKCDSTVALQPWGRRPWQMWTTELAGYECQPKCDRLTFMNQSLHE